LVRRLSANLINWTWMSARPESSRRPDVFARDRHAAGLVVGPRGNQREGESEQQRRRAQKTPARDFTHGDVPGSDRCNHPS
jgi:hypothetical protein